MPVLDVISTKSGDFARRWAQLKENLSLEAALLGNPERLEAVRGILKTVRERGDAAVADLTLKLDKVPLAADQFRIPPAQLDQAHAALNPDLLEAIRQAIDNVRRYQQAILHRPPADLSEKGVNLGVRYRPLNRVGVCVPGASAPLPSTVIMSVVPAQVAGVKEIAIISSPSYQGSIHPVILGVCRELGVSEVYRVSGAQAVAALAFGTETIPKVDKIVGPSSIWGQLAKKEVFGLVDIDSFAGPSDVLIVADDSARADWVAADLLSQAEHAPGSGILVTDSEKLARQVAAEVESQLTQLTRGEQTRNYVRATCLAVVTRDLDEAVKLANDFAPEHLQVQTRQPEQVAARLSNAGAIFIGPYTPVAVGDYFAGPSHVLPVGGTARFFGPLNANDFIKTCSIVRYEEQALRAAAPMIEKLALTEGLDAHAQSVTKRLN